MPCRPPPILTFRPLPRLRPACARRLIWAPPNARFSSCWSWPAVRIIFPARDLPLMSVYYRVVNRERTAAGELATGGYVTAHGKSSPWARHLKDATLDLTVMSRLLRLNPVVRPSSAEPASYYERTAMEAARDGRN